jgi:carbon storage regulator CsrA
MNGQSIKIGEFINVKVLSVDINEQGFTEVTIGVTAPKEVTILLDDIKKRSTKNGKK